MKKFTLLVAVLAFIVAGVTGASAQSLSTIAKGSPAAVQDNGITGFQAPATPTITLTSAAQLIGTLPANCVAVTLVASGAFNYGGSTVLTSTDGAYMTVADKAQVTIPIWPHTTNPQIYVVANATGTSPVVRIVPHVQK